MDPALTLPERMYLLAYDLRKDRPADKAWLDFVVRGAALAQLLAEGRLTDTGQIVIPAGEPPADEVLNMVRQEAGDQPRNWRTLLRNRRATLAAVQDQLIATGLVGPAGRHVVARDRAAIARLQARARQVIADGDADGRAGILDMVLVALASVIPLRTLFYWRRRRQDRARVADLTRLISARVPGFDRLIRQMRRTRGLAYSAGGPVQ